MSARGTLQAIADNYRTDHGARAPWTFRVPAIATRGFTRTDMHGIRQAARRIAAIAASATETQFADGVSWYADARRAVEPSAIVGRFARATVHAVDTARVLACVSPGLPWERNVDGVRAVYQTVLHGVPIADAVRAYGLPVPYGWRPWTDAVAVARGAALTGRKRQAFARGVITGGDTEHVTVDGHAYLAAWTDTDGGARPAIGRAVNVTERRFDATAAAYALASVAIADATGAAVSPAQAQAIVWTVWRDRAVAR